MGISSNDLAIQRTRFANQRTYLAYMRTGFIIAAIAGIFKKYWIVFFGIIMIMMSTVQYYFLNKMLNEKEAQNYAVFDIVPVIYVLLSFGTLYLQWNSENSSKNFHK